MTKIIITSNTDWFLYRYRLSLARFLRSQGNKVSFVSPNGRFVPKLEAEGFEWIEWNVGRQTINPFTELSAILRLAKIFRQAKPKIVHLLTIKPVIYGSLAAKLMVTRSPAVVHSVTGRGYVFVSEAIKARLLRPLVKLLYRYILKTKHSATIFENNADRDYFVQNHLVRSNQATVIDGLGVDTDFYQPLPEKDQKPTVILATRMLWDKGVGIFVEAARLLKQEDIARFVLVGEPDPGNPSSIEIQTLKDWEDEGLVEWWGFKDDMVAVFAESHIVTLPSFGEGLPVVLLEASACARSIVATDVPGCQDVVQHGVNGFLVPPNDASELAKAIKKLLRDKDLRQRMGEAGRRMAVERFSTKLINQSTMDVYHKLLTPKS